MDELLTALPPDVATLVAGAPTEPVSIAVLTPQWDDGRRSHAELVLWSWDPLADEGNGVTPFQTTSVASGQSEHHADGAHGQALDDEPHFLTMRLHAPLAFIAAVDDPWGRLTRLVARAQQVGAGFADALELGGRQGAELVRQLTDQGVAPAAVPPTSWTVTTPWRPVRPADLHSVVEAEHGPLPIDPRPQRLSLDVPAVATCPACSGGLWDLPFGVDEVIDDMCEPHRHEAVAAVKELVGRAESRNRAAWKSYLNARESTIDFPLHVPWWLMGRWFRSQVAPEPDRDALFGWTLDSLVEEADVLIELAAWAGTDPSRIDVLECDLGVEAEDWDDRPFDSLIPNLTIQLANKGESARAWAMTEAGDTLSSYSRATAWAELATWLAPHDREMAERALARSAEQDDLEPLTHQCASSALEALGRPAEAAEHLATAIEWLSSSASDNDAEMCLDAIRQLDELLRQHEDLWEAHDTGRWAAERQRGEEVAARRTATMRAMRAASGVPAVSTKISRNEPCPCGSGNKYKKCHGRA